MICTPCCARHITKTLCQPKIENGEHNKKPTEMARPDSADAFVKEIHFLAEMYFAYA